LAKWFRTERFPQKMSWLCLSEPKIAHSDVLALAEQISPQLSNLFDEVTEANQILEGIPRDKFQTLRAEEKWQKVFEAELPELYKLVSIILSVPVSNAYIERVFSLMGSQWTDERNSLKVETVKALVQVKVNFDLTCPQMYQMLISNRKLLDLIGGWEKYK
jgi:hypothetical protein